MPAAKGEHRSIQTNRVDEPQIARCLVRICVRSAAHPIGQDQAQQITAGTEHEGLRDELPHDPVTAGSERRSHRNLLAPAGRPRKHQARDVCTRDEEHQDDGAEQQQKQRPKLADEIVLAEDHGKAQPCVGLGKSLLEAARDGTQFGSGGLHAHAGSQPRDQTCTYSLPFLLAVMSEEKYAPYCSGGIESAHRASHGEARRHHADYRMRDTVEHYRTAEHTGVAVKLLLPQRVAEHDDARVPGVISGTIERAPNRRLNSKHVEESCIDLSGFKTACPAVASQCHLRVHEAATLEKAPISRLSAPSFTLMKFGGDSAVPVCPSPLREWSIISVSGSFSASGRSSIP